jgi:hypothetical protein
MDLDDAANLPVLIEVRTELAIETTRPHDQNAKRPFCMYNCYVTASTLSGSTVSEYMSRLAST